MKTSIRLVGVVLLATLSSAGSAHANPMFFSQFTARYPKSPLLNSVKCGICHSMGLRLNPYGMDFAKSKNKSKDWPTTFAAIEGLDSDGDGKSNIEEINAGTPPGVKN